MPATDPSSTVTSNTFASVAVAPITVASITDLPTKADHDHFLRTFGVLPPFHARERAIVIEDHSEYIRAGDTVTVHSIEGRGPRGWLLWVLRDEHRSLMFAGNLKPVEA